MSTIGTQNTADFASEFGDRMQSDADKTIAIATTMFALFISVWWAIILTNIERKAEIDGDKGQALFASFFSSYGVFSYGVFIAVLVVVILSIHALLMSRTRVSELRHVVNPIKSLILSLFWNQKQPAIADWRLGRGVIFMLAFGIAICWGCSRIADDIAANYSFINRAEINNGADLTVWWVVSTWIIMGLVELIASITWWQKGSMNAADDANDPNAPAGRIAAAADATVPTTPPTIPAPPTELPT